MWQVDYLVLADAATAVEGKHYIHGAGWDVIMGASFPLAHTFALALRLRVPWLDTNQPQAIAIDLIDADGRSILPESPGAIRGNLSVGRPPHITLGADQVVPLAFQLSGVQFPQPGDYVVVVRLGGLEAARSPFHVGLLPGAATPTPQPGS